MAHHHPTENIRRDAGWCSGSRHRITRVLFLASNINKEARLK